MRGLPELLAPAGSPEALRAAIAAGADAVYFGVGAHNARMNARNFDGDELSRAISLCHAHGVRAHITLNTQLYDRELDDALRVAETLYLAGADALIVADIGLAGLIHSYFPDFELHASTQACGHSVRDAEYFASLGFSRMVCARELSHADIKTLVERSPIDIEMFVHGAICVSVSGQCLFSSLIGGRSGNRGQCAQPCRLPYGNGYPLSPRDLCLAGHMSEIISSGVSSLKIEGRMKSPDYVYRVTSVYRRLLDERRDGSDDDIAELTAAFSRSGFSDGYYTGAVKMRPNDMLGVRTQKDKEASRSTETTVPEVTRVPIDEICAVIRRGEAAVTFSACGKSVTVKGDIPAEAITRPMTAETVKAQLIKLGGTPFTVTDETKYNIETDGGSILPVSALNELRRRAAASLTAPDGDAREAALPTDPVPRRATILPTRTPVMTAEFLRADQITECAREYFDEIYLPLDAYDAVADGFVMPAVVYDSECEKVEAMIAEAVGRGARSCILSGAGQQNLVAKYGLTVTAGFRYNICNTESAVCASAGCVRVTVSPELGLAGIRDIAAHVPASVTVYGRIPLMTTERCIIRAVSGDKCICGKGPVTLRDRMGIDFPMLKADGCRTVIYNSVPVYMSDKKDDMRRTGCAAWHFMFTTEDSGEVDRVIRDYETGGEPPKGKRRIK